MSKLRKIGFTSIMVAGLAAGPAASAQAATPTLQNTARPASINRGSVVAPIIRRSLYEKRLEFLAGIMGITQSELEAQLKASAKGI